MPHSSRYRLTKLSPWIHNSEGCWKRPIRLLKMVINRSAKSQSRADCTLAGIPLEKASGSKTAVFVGSFAKEYETIFSRDPEFQPIYQATGTGSAMLANRVSWFYDFRGPSITLDTACSSSLNALHLACSSLRNRESTMVSLGRGRTFSVSAQDDQARLGSLLPVAM